MTVTTEKQRQPKGMWVTVDRVTQAWDQWFYTLTDEEPGSPRSCTIHNRQTPINQHCRSYTELCAWLHIYGLTPPPLEYFASTPEEQAAGAESIVRPLVRPRSHTDKKCA